jgi:hypothetical protein
VLAVDFGRMTSVYVQQTVLSYEFSLPFELWTEKQQHEEEKVHAFIHF